MPGYGVRAVVRFTFTARGRYLPLASARLYRNSQSHRSKMFHFTAADDVTRVKNRLHFRKNGRFDSRNAEKSANWAGKTRF